MPKAESKEPMRLDMAAVSKAEPSDDYEKLARALDAQILVVFELPDGSEGEKHFKLGHTVEVLKSYVEDEFDIPMARQTLYLDRQLMRDPLTLADFPAVQDAPCVYVRVEGDMPDSASRK